VADDDEARLVAWLRSRGVDEATIAEARARGQLNGNLATDRLIRPVPTLTVADAAARLGHPVDETRGLVTALGLVAPDGVAALTDDDLSLLGLVHAAAGQFSEREVLHLARTLGRAMRQVAEAVNELFMAEVESPLVAEGVDQVNLAEQSEAAIGLLEVAVEQFPTLLRAHLIQALEMSRAARRAGGGVDRLVLVVGFVDLSGFTAATESASAADVLALALDFAAVAADTVTTVGGRVVKMIGDEVMFTALDGDGAAAAGLGLLRWAAEELPTPVSARGGLAMGPVIAHGGDHYGAVVNRAARLAEVAATDELLVDDAVAADLAEHDPEPAGRRELKGFSVPVPVWSLRP